MAFVGIDPGSRGGVAIVSRAGEILRLESMPAVAARFNPQAFISLLKDIVEQSSWHEEPIDLAVIEQVGAMPGNGVCAMFSFGYCAGAIEAGVAAMGWRYNMVRPQGWQKVLHEGVDKSRFDAKQRSLIIAQRIFPKETWIPPRGKKPHDGLIDAALLAEYGRRTMFYGQRIGAQTGGS